MIDIIEQIQALPIGEHLSFILVMFVLFSASEFAVNIFKSLCRKKAQYDCDKCRVWDCPVHNCKMKKEKIEKH